MAELSAALPSSSKSSCSASTSYVHFDVFINHCSRDTDAGTFANALYSRLISRDLHVFLDKLVYEEEEVTSQMEAAISVASVQIAIFSPNYAEWKWCLDALLHMSKSEATILPVFYKVKPSEVRWTGKHKDGPYAHWLRDHEEKERYDSQSIENWRNVLRDVSELSGFKLEACNGDEEELLDKVVETVFKVCHHPHYDVFINHRGPDTKEQYAGPLYDRLISSGLRVFLDKPELVEGLNITSQIELAIGVASVQIAIFSSTYARSNWCLDELSLMTMSGATILPVFYEVEPSVLYGVYAETLAEHEKRGRYNLETIQKWRAALEASSEVAKKKCFVVDENQEELLDLIVRSVLENVPERSRGVQSSEVQSVVKCVLMENDPKSCNVVQNSQVEEEHSLGLKKKLEDFEKEVLSEGKEGRVEAKVVGIVGVIGVGKTTLAEEFLKCKKSDYSQSTFLFHVTQHGRRRKDVWALTDLRWNLINVLAGEYTLTTGTEDEDDYDDDVEYNYDDYEDEQPKMVILDDVNDVDQLEVLVLELKKALHAMSLILVTSRSKDVLIRSGIVHSSIYHLTGLNEEHSRMFFRSCAFNQGYQIPGFTDMIDKFVKACHGLPLLLKVVGALFCGEDRSFWEKQLNELHNCIQPAKIYHAFEMSYHSLDKIEQEIFLDLACFFIGKDRDTAIRVWGKAGLEKLENRCLLEVDSKNKIKMHDHLRHMGRCIAKGLMPGRLWHQTTRNIYDLLEQSSSVPFQFRGITMTRPVDVLDFSNETEACLRSAEMFRNQIPGKTNLKFVAAEGGYLEDILRSVGSPDLRWLHWYKCPCSNLPSWIPMDNLRVLEVAGSKLKELWRDGSEAPLQLRELNISAPLSAFPTSLGQLEHLEKIVLKDLRSQPLTIRTLPEEFCHLRFLKYLELRDCSSMRSLPDSFGELTNLRYIDLKGASSLLMLPDSFWNLTLLKHLSLRECREIQKLPGLQHLTCLEMLDVGGCEKLEMLDVTGCVKLQSIRGLGQLTKLQTLFVCRCFEIQKLQLGVHEMQERRGVEHLTSNLETLYVRDCQRLQSIEGLGQLRKLQWLYVRGCPEIQKLQLGVHEMQERPGVEDLTYNLEMLDVRDCQKLQSIEGLGQLRKLQSLYVHGCPEIQKLQLGVHEMQERPGVKDLTYNLEVLHVRDCQKLQSIEGLGQLRKLQWLYVDGCPEKQKLQLDVHEMQERPGVEDLTYNLEMLDVRDCQKLQSIEGLGQLRKLQGLIVHGCPEIQKLQLGVHEMQERRGVEDLTYDFGDVGC